MPDPTPSPPTQATNQGPGTSNQVPILLDLPDELAGPRVLVRPYRTGDGAALWEAVEESREHIMPWLPWGDTHKSPDDSEAFARRMQANWLLREDLSLSIWDRAGARYLGGSGLHRADWKIPSFEIGYWLRKSAAGQGYMTEAVRLITELAFTTLGAKRVFIRCAAANTRSAAVPPRAGYTLEGVLRNSHVDARGALHDMMLFAMTPEDYERALPTRS
ncbi:MAG TPA: GNAT family protein [Chthonomonadaceae bacterium]|nr:GNAT family protein [Chthonomonadaceae bacterium]